VSKLCLVNYFNFLKHCISLIRAICPTHFILSRNHENSRYTIFYILLLFPLHKNRIFSSQRPSQTPCNNVLLFKASDRHKDLQQTIIFMEENPSRETGKPSDGLDIFLN